MRTSGRDRLVRKLRKKLSDGLLGVQSYFGGIRPHERAAEDPARQARNVVALERLEEGNGNPGCRCNLSQRHAPLLPGALHLRTDIDGRAGHVTACGRSLSNAAVARPIMFGNVRPEIARNNPMAANPAAPLAARASNRSSVTPPMARMGTTVL